MGLKDKLDLLQSDVDCNIAYFTQKHLFTKRRATLIKISSVTFSAFITVILGIDIAGLTSILKNIAIVLGAIVTIINAVDAFYNYNSLWVKNTMTLAKLKELRREILFYSSGCEVKDISETKINKYMNELQKILKDDIRQWLRIREKVGSFEQENENTTLSDIKLGTIKKNEQYRSNTNEGNFDDIGNSIEKE